MDTTEHIKNTTVPLCKDLYPQNWFLLCDLDEGADIWSDIARTWVWVLTKKGKSYKRDFWVIGKLCHYGLCSSIDDIKSGQKVWKIRPLGRKWAANYRQVMKDNTIVKETKKSRRH